METAFKLRRLNDLRCSLPHMSQVALVAVLSKAQTEDLPAVRCRKEIWHARDAVVIFKADGKRSAIRELGLPPGMRATVARGAPPAPPPAPAEAPPEAPPSPEEPKKRWFERARKVSIR